MKLLFIDKADTGEMPGIINKLNIWCALKRNPLSNCK